MPSVEEIWRALTSLYAHGRGQEIEALIRRAARLRAIEKLTDLDRWGRDFKSMAIADRLEKLRAEEE